MKLFCLGFIFFVTQISFAQNVQLAIKDSSNQPIYGVIIYKNSLKIGSFFSDVISFDAKMNDTIQVKSNFYEDYEVVINEANFANDTLKMIINLAPKTRLLNEVIILAKETTTYYDVQNSFVIDYFPYGDLCFYATKEKEERYLQLNRGDAVIHKIKINFAPTEFYLDIFGNFHLLSKDSVYQIWSNETQLSWINPISLDIFNQQILPLVGKTDSCVFVQKKEHSNKFYTVNSIKNNTSNVCYNTFDKIAYQVAKSQEIKIINMYYAAVPSYENVIELGLWNGDLAQLQTFNDRNITTEIGWYKAALDNPIRCEAFGMENHLVIVDIYADTVSLLDYKTGGIYQKNKLNIPISKSGVIFYDYFFDIIYFIDNNGKGIDIYEFDPKTGNAKLLKGIYDVPFVQNIKISGNWVYFELKEPSGYNKILRQRIR